jgi:hypothetical protein
MRTTRITRQKPCLYIIGPDHKLRLSMLYPASVGRNVDETLQVIDSLQVTDRLKIITTPANRTPGTKVMILPHVKDEDLPKLFSKGVDKVSMPSGISYIKEVNPLFGPRDSVRPGTYREALIMATNKRTL